MNTGCNPCCRYEQEVPIELCVSCMYSCSEGNQEKELWDVPAICWCDVTHSKFSSHLSMCTCCFSVMKLRELLGCLYATQPCFVLPLAEIVYMGVCVLCRHGIRKDIADDLYCSG